MQAGGPFLDTSNIEEEPPNYVLKKRKAENIFTENNFPIFELLKLPF